ncbi:MAG: DUF2164 family protein [Candidatus Paceibacterota bacterium]
MNHIERNTNLLSKEERKIATDAIIGYFFTERKEEIGVIAAEDILNFFLLHVGTQIYNNGLEIARSAIDKGFEESNSKISELMQ